MAKLSVAQISTYKRKLKEYAAAYNKLALGMRGGYQAYEKLTKEVYELAVYLRMIEDMRPELVEHKPGNYTAIYRPLADRNR